jgi:hypothetical protein
MVEVSQSVKVRVKGQWVLVPILKVNDDILVATGKWLRIARVRGEEMKEREIGPPELYLETLRSDKERKLKADIFSFTQKLPSIQPKYSYPMEGESIAAISLVSYKEWWERLPQETRKNVRRSQKRGVTIRVKEFDDELIDGIRAVNAYYKLTSEETRDRYSEFVGRCEFICAYYGEEMVGFLHLVYRGDVAAILNLSAKPSHFDKRPANALMAKAVEICEAHGISHVTYGLYNYGNKRDSSLREFKIRNGFEEILVPRYYVPLTPWGRLCIKLKFHRGLIGNLPPSLISAGLRARTLWYDLKKT